MGINNRKFIPCADLSTTDNRLRTCLLNARNDLILFQRARNEILNFGGLTPGNQYLVAIRNFNSIQGIGTFSLCISKLNQTTCDYPGPNFSLCDWYKADYTGAQAYVFHFTPLDGGDEITVTKYGTTVLPLTNVPGLQYEHDYQVTIDAVYQLNFENLNHL